jgi:ribosomal protein L30/L7E
MYGYNAEPLPCPPPLQSTIATTNRKEKTMSRLRIAAVCATVLLSLTPTTLVAIQLNPVATGLASPLFVGNAGDLSNRLFIV